MCGICGEIDFESLPDLAAVQRMREAMHHRGPDASGTLSYDHVAMAHRRLSIIDLAATSQQPMCDPALGLSIVFNGCIYNYRDLRGELEAMGYAFFSGGDTEVILKAYHAWGLDFVTRFHGMFAFALLERDSGRVVLGRDRLGIKPLYYARTNRRLRFASTLPALLAAGDVDTSIDPVALHQYLSLHAVVPPPRTILNGVRKLAPATLMIFERDGACREHRYWSVMVGDHDGDRRSEAEWRDALLDTLRRAVERRAVADVPVGVLLSGGLDSSLLVALLAERQDQHIETFSIGFDAVAGQSGDEFQYSDLVARRFATTHHRIPISATRTLGALDGAIANMSEPMMSHDAVGFYLLAQEVSRHVKVVQSGQGADEILGGYHWYPKLMASNDPLEDYSRLYFDRDHAEMRETLHGDLLSDDHSRDFVQTFFDSRPSQSSIDKVLQIDSEIMLVDDPVKRVDNMTMAWGLEARVPFLDHEVVELAARMPAELKVGGGGKYILKQAARRLLPAEIIDRPKGYFPVPALRHLQGPYLEAVRDRLTSRRARERGVFNRGYVDRLLDAPEGALTPKGHSKLWQAGLLESWLQTHGL